MFPKNQVSANIHYAAADAQNELFGQLNLLCVVTLTLGIPDTS
jgi:hypothetical protein